jgi:hypothetical protein
VRRLLASFAANLCGAAAQTCRSKCGWTSDKKQVRRANTASKECSRPIGDSIPLNVARAKLLLGVFLVEQSCSAAVATFRLTPFAGNCQS